MRRWSLHVAAVGALGLSLAVGGCGDGDRDAAGKVAGGYLTAVGANDWGRAWRLACEDDRSAISVTELRAANGAALLRARNVRVAHVVVEGSVAAAMATYDDASARPTKAAKVAKAAPARRVRVLVANLRRERGAWCVDTDWAENAAGEAEVQAHLRALERANDLAAEAGRLLDSDPRAAKAKLEEARRLDPELVGFEHLARRVDEEISSIVAGAWRRHSSTDPMTDDVNTVLRLAATDTIADAIGEPKRPSLMARCAERRLELFVAIGIGVDSDYGELFVATARYRFGAEQAQTIRLLVSDARNAVFFPRPSEMMTTLIERRAEPFRLEVRLYGVGARTMTFDLRGADVALAGLRDACAPAAGASR